MGILINITKNCTFDNISHNESLCHIDTNSEGINEMKHLGYTNKSLNGTTISEKDNEFEKSMEMVFEVGLLTIFGFFGVIGNVAAIVLFAR